MRKLMYFALGFSGACGFCFYTESRYLILAAAVFSSIFFAAVGREGRFWRKFLLLIFGFAVGSFWYGRFDESVLQTAAAWDGETRTVSIRTADYSYETGYGMAVDGTLAIGERTYQVKVYLDPGEPLEPGILLTGQFRFRVTTPDSTEEATHHPGKGIFLLAYQEGEITRTTLPSQWQDRPARMRRDITQILFSCFPPETAAFANALLLGDSSALDYGVDTALKISGIRHVIAVSGLHVSVLFALIREITFRKRFLTALLGFPALCLFAALAGFTPSVTRACIMSALMLLAMVFGREYDGPTALSFAVLMMLLGNPLVITSVGFQLSVGSVAGIFLFYPGIQKWMLSHFAKPKESRLRKRMIRWLTASVSVTVSAMVLTTPLSAYYFGAVSLIGVVTNLLTLWIISLIFYGVIGVCLFHVLLPGAAGILVPAVTAAIHYVLWIAAHLSRLPFAAVYTRSEYITAWLVFVYYLLGLFLISRNRKPAELFCCAVLGLCFAVLAGLTEPIWDDMRFTVLDVGQGQCLILQSEGRTFLVDCGGHSDTETADIAAETLLSQGVTKLDGLILTHCDRDHAGAAENLLSRLDTGVLILPPVREMWTESVSAEVIYAQEDLELTFGESKICIYAPDFPGNSNEMSLCILFDTKKCDILITGDRNGFGERSLLRNADIPDVDILVAGHHGSKNSTCEELLSAVRPEIVCISVGAENSYGHPAPELLQRLNRYGCAVYRTDQHGTILIRR